MIRFMICDTDTAFLDKLASMLHRLFDPCAVEYMYGPAALEVSLRADSGGADILLTEIELRRENAIKIIARDLVESSPLQIIYMTSKIKYCTEVYDTPHCGFLLKPIDIRLLERDVRRAVKLLENRKECGIVLQKNSSLHIVSPSSLIYIEGRGHIVRVITDNEVLETYEKISSISYQLDKRFLQCHKSYIVNMERVRKLCGDKFLMDNGAAVPISQSHRKESKNQFITHMGNTTKGIKV